MHVIHNYNKREQLSTLKDLHPQPIINISIKTDLGMGVHETLTLKSMSTILQWNKTKNIIKL